MAKARFVLNRAGIGALLRGEAGDYVERIARANAGEGLVVSRVAGRTRANIRVEDPRDGSLDRNAKTGHLTRVLGGGGQ